MLYNEQLMRKICAQYNIEVIEEKGAPTFNGEKITKEMINEILSDHKGITQQSIDFKITLAVSNRFKLSGKSKFFPNDSNSDFAA
ncbi:hypothetical protein [Caproiciproducens faecalis]|uniref:Uncharacterized protein n=1 Tax=Caproiciproducens faecalis TaxID=2820301 RepID=A0ABS7DTL3_9FIRM|nr:hypothetical protein [Caproiciproducens faecalis]MBW7573931.1 hypothetical protein [Caproiciproducens faecalis]